MKELGSMFLLDYTYNNHPKRPFRIYHINYYLVSSGLFYQSDGTSMGSLVAAFYRWAFHVHFASNGFEWVGSNFFAELDDNLMPRIVRGTS